MVSELFSHISEDIQVLQASRWKYLSKLHTILVQESLTLGLANETYQPVLYTKMPAKIVIPEKNLAIDCLYTSQYENFASKFSKSISIYLHTSKEGRVLNSNWHLNKCTR